MDLGGKGGWRFDEAVTIGMERENESAAAGGLSPSPRTDVFLRLIFLLRVYSTVSPPPSPGDFTPPEQPEKILFLQSSFLQIFDGIWGGA